MDDFDMNNNFNTEPSDDFEHSDGNDYKENENTTTDGVSNDEKPVTEETDQVNHESDYISDYCYTEPSPPKEKNKGLKIFTAILCLVLLVSTALSGGYFVGRYYSKTNVKAYKSPSVDLEPRPESDDEMHQNYSEVYSSINESVVNILAYNDDATAVSISSGVIYSKDGYIVTNDHIYENIPEAKFLVRMYDGTECKAKFVAGDVRSDLAVIKLEEEVKNLKPAVFGNSDEVIVGEPVIAVGYSSSYGDSSTITHGVISAVNRRVTGTSTNYASTFLQTDTAINPGNSGGALSNMFGQIIGIPSSKLISTGYDSVSYAIPTTTMKRVVTSLIKEGCVSDRAKLGITYTEINSLLSDINKLPVGVMIKSISDDSDLADSGFGSDDIITHVNGAEITTSDVLLNVIEIAKAGDVVELTIYKHKERTSEKINVKLLADKGTSSYSNKSNKVEADDDIFQIPDNSDDSGTFNFPKGD